MRMIVKTAYLAIKSINIAFLSRLEKTVTAWINGLAHTRISAEVPRLALAISIAFRVELRRFAFLTTLALKETITTRAYIASEILN